MRLAETSVFAMATFVMATGPALAGWNFTEWGMTPEQVVRASGGTVQLSDGPVPHSPTVREGAKGLIQSGEVRMEVRFRFNATGLIEVSLNPADPSGCVTFAPALNAKYGKPSSSFGAGTDYAGATWVVAASDMSVTLLGSPGECSATYRPLNSSGF